MTACPKRCPAFDPHHPMQKPTSTVSFLLIATACVLVVLGIIAAVNVYQTYAALADAASRISPGLKIDHFLAIWVAGATFFGAFCTSLILAALAQITETALCCSRQAFGQDPPQSTPVSVPFWIPSLHVGGLLNFG